MSTNSKWISRETLRDLTHYLIPGLHRAGAQANLTFSVGKRVRPFRIRRNAVRDIYADHIEVFTQPPERYVSLGPSNSASFVRMDLHNIRVESRLRPTHERSPMSRALLKWSIIKAFEKRSIFSIHCSGVSSDDGIRLFVGRTGSGKTAILLQFLMNGHRMLADDFVFFREKTLYPFSFRSTLHRDSVKKLEEKHGRKPRALKSTATLTDLTGQFDVELDKVALDSVFLYYLRVRNSTRTKLFRITPQKMLGFMIDSYLAEFDNSYWFGWQRSEVVRRILQAYSPLIESAQCFEVLAGEDSDDRYRKIVMA